MLHPWSGQIVQEGVETGDGRVFEPNALSWATPVPLAWLVTGTQHTFDGEAPTIGTVDTIVRGDDGWLTATGMIDDETEHGAEMIRALNAGSASHGDRMGVSVDLDDMAIEVIDRVLPDTPGDDDGVVASGRVVARLSGLVAAAGDPIDDEGEVIFEDAQDLLLMRCTRARIRGLTCVATPAFADAALWLDSTATVTEDDQEDDTDDDDDAVTAAGISSNPVVASAPLAPPADWFDDPGLPGPTPMTIDDNGRLYGHVAAWGTCHTSYEQCVTPPRGGNYSTFMSAGRVRCDNGQDVSTGALVWGIPHADLSLPLLAAFEHYANAKHGFADVRVGEDDHGIWCAGVLRPGVTDEDVRVLRALSISGDWRYRNGGLDMIAGLAVNTPGFPIPSDTGLAASAAPEVRMDHGTVYALVAAGVVANAGTAEHVPCGCSTTDPVLERIAADVQTLMARTRHLVPDAVAAAAGRISFNT